MPTEGDPTIVYPMANGRRSTKLVRLLCLGLLGLVAAQVVMLTVLTHVGVGTVLGRDLEVVRSGSMVPTFRTGDLVIDRPISGTEAGTLRVGQIISFRVPAGSGSMTFTHRISAVTAAGYQTKGDANNAADSQPVPASRVIGVYESRIPDGGYVLAFVHTRSGLALVVLLPLLALLAPELIRAWSRGTEPAEADHSVAAQLSLLGGPTID